MRVIAIGLVLVLALACAEPEAQPPTIASPEAAEETLLEPVSQPTSQPEPTQEHTYVLVPVPVAHHLEVGCAGRIQATTGQLRAAAAKHEEAFKRHPFYFGMWYGQLWDEASRHPTRTSGLIVFVRPR